MCAHNLKHRKYFETEAPFNSLNISNHHQGDKTVVGFVLISVVPWHVGGGLFFKSRSKVNEELASREDGLPQGL